MRFQVMRASEGSVSKTPPCPGAIRGPEASAFPGEFLWYLEVETLDDLIRLLDANGGLGLWSAAEGEGHPVIELDDEDEGCAFHDHAND